MPSLFGGEEEGVLQTCQPLGLEAEPRNRGLPITGSQSPGPNQINKQTNTPFFTAPGTETNIAITATHHTRQTEPYKTNCTSTYPPTKGIFNVGNSKYSTKICKQTCMIEFIHKICGCIGKSIF